MDHSEVDEDHQLAVLEGQLRKQSVPQLRKKCQDLDLSTSGKKKSVLVERILEHKRRSVGILPGTNFSGLESDEDVSGGPSVLNEYPTLPRHQQELVDRQIRTRQMTEASLQGEGSTGPEVLNEYGLGIDGVEAHSDLLRGFQALIQEVQRSNASREEELLKKISSLEVQALNRDGQAQSIETVGMDPVRIKAAFRQHEERLRSALEKLKRAIKEDRDRVVVETHLSKLRKQEERFKAFIENKVYWMDGDDLKDQIQEAAVDISEECDEIECQANRYLFEARKQAEEDAKAGALAVGFKPPEFNGNPLNFSAFWEAFEAKVHKNRMVSKFYKMQYLIDALKGPAAEVLSGMPNTADHYESAVQNVIKRFGRNRLVFRHIVHSILDQESPSSSDHKALRLMRDRFCNRLAAIKSQKVAPTVEMLLLPILESKLPQEIREEWELKIAQEVEKDEFATETQFISFLTAKVESKEAANLKFNDDFGEFVAKRREEKEKTVTGNPRRYYSSQNLVAKSNEQEDSMCPSCNQMHNIIDCPKFRAMDVDSRWNEFSINAQMYRVCFRCLGWRFGPRNHGRSCQQKCSARSCGGNHHVLLHRDAARYENLKPGSTPALLTSSKTMRTSKNAGETAQKGRILPTIKARIQVGVRCKEVKIGLDTFAAHSYITRELSEALDLVVVESFDMEVHGFGGKVTSGRADLVQFELLPCVEGVQGIEVQAIVKSGMICSPIPPVEIDLKVIPELAGWPVPEMLPKEEVKLDVLLGVDHCWKLIQGATPIENTELVVLNTNFGPILTGTCGSSLKNGTANCMLITLPNHKGESKWQVDKECSIEKMMERFWEVESIGIMDKNVVKTQDDKEAIASFEKYFKKGLDGRYEVGLPFRKDRVRLLDNYSSAKRQLESTERRLSKDVNLKEKYSNAIQEYLVNGFARKLEREELDNLKTGEIYYVPHHGVIRQDSVSTDLRVVFNASSPGPNGVSLNDVLLPGPALQNDLVQILIRFRTHRIAITGDIKKMFCQTNIRKSDHRYQLFLWRGCDPNIPPQTYAMTTIMFGVTCSPFLAMNSVNKHVKSSEVVKIYPKACEEVSRNIFVDDVATGASDERGAIELCSSLQDLFQEGGWEITKFASNSTELMKTIPRDKRMPGIMVDLDDNLEGVSHTSTLGLKWDTSLDMLSCKVSANLIGQVQMDLPVTKRRILAYHASIYDVFGFFGPFIIRAKILMQALWKQKCSWDEVIEGKIAESFRKWCGEVPRLPEIGIPRWIGIISEDQKLELVGFGDASEVAYGAVVYARVVEPNGSVSISFMISKTRVAPLKFKSIARLELLGAHLLCRLMKFVEEALTYRVSAKTYFTDSSVVLSWLGKSSFEWKTFVKNRVQEIHDESAATEWHHCSGSDNPSDLLSRGASLSEIEQSLLYWEGPSWLKEERGSWPNLFGDLSNDNILTMDQERCPQSSAMITTRLHYPEFLVKFSSFRKLLRVIARIMRWRNPVPSQGVDVNELSTEEIMNAEVQICRIIQGRHFPEFEVILEGRMISRDSNLLPLNPTLCPVRNVLITGDRIRLSDLPSEMKHPIILPPNDILVGLLIQSVHESHAHAAQETTLTILRNKYHIVHGRTEVRKVLRRCMVCRQYRTKPMQQRMGILPKERVSIAPAFTHVGLDFTGPLLIRSSSGVPRKAYICVFTCAASRGVHFELTNDMSTGEFLGALTRMINRRGKPSTIFSDNAKCFIKANKMLRQAYARVNRIEIDSGSLQRFLSNRDIKWKFISERAPHRGAFWERLNRSLKEPLRIILGRALLSYSEMMTVLTEIEASLNSRPLTYQDSDDGAKEPITPAHLMLGRPIVQISDLLGGSTSISKRYQFLTQVLDNFWRRWSREYIPTLMSRRKWQTVEVAPRIGDVCLISEENVKRPRWPMGVIIEAIAGSDGLVRTFKLRTTKGILCRPIQKLHLLVENRTKDEESDTALEEKISNSQKEELIFPLPVKDQGGEDIHNLVTRSGKRIPRRR